MASYVLGQSIGQQCGGSHGRERERERTADSVEPVEQEVVAEDWELVALVAQELRDFRVERELPLVHVVLRLALLPVALDVVPEREVRLDRVRLFVVALDHWHFDVVDAAQERVRVELASWFDPVLGKLHPARVALEHEWRTGEPERLDAVARATGVDVDHFDRLVVELLPVRRHCVDRVLRILFVLVVVFVGLDVALRAAVRRLALDLLARARRRCCGCGARVERPLALRSCCWLGVWRREAP